MMDVAGHRAEQRLVASLRRTELRKERREKREEEGEKRDDRGEARDGGGSVRPVPSEGREGPAATSYGKQGRYSILAAN
jgi:hypothetical protein